MEFIFSWPRFNVNNRMSISGLDLLFIEVNNVEESLHFYSGVLGFQVNRHNPDSEPPMATLQVGTLKITLAQHLETMLRRGRGVNFFLGVDDVDEYYRELRQHGADVHPPADEGWGGRFITLQDPDKYRFFFVEWSDKESDRLPDQKPDSKEYSREEAAQFLD